MPSVSKAGLVKKMVSIRAKHGGIYKAYRWVKPNFSPSQVYQGKWAQKDQPQKKTVTIQDKEGKDIQAKRWTKPSSKPGYTKEKEMKQEKLDQPKEKIDPGKFRITISKKDGETLLPNKPIPSEQGEDFTLSLETGQLTDFAIKRLKETIKDKVESVRVEILYGKESIYSGVFVPSEGKNNKWYIDNIEHLKIDRWELE